MSRKNIILGGILIILIILVYFYQGPLEKWQSNINKPNNFFSNINQSLKILLKERKRVVLRNRIIILSILS